MKTKLDSILKSRDITWPTKVHLVNAMGFPWVWVNSGNWWWTERPGVLWFMGSKKVRHDWETELNWIDGFSGSHVWMWELDYKESWAPKNWTVVLEKTLESPLDCEEIQPVHSEGDQPWDFFGSTEPELQYFGHLMRRVDSLEKTLMLGAIAGRRKSCDRGWDGWDASPTQWT